MNQEKLDISSLEQAITRLQEGLTRYQSDITDTQIRDGLIQRFEFSYELSHKMLKRYLELSSPSPEQYDSMAFADLIRSGNEQGLLMGQWTHWKKFRDMRGKTSYTYDEDIALEVVANIPDKHVPTHEVWAFGSRAKRTAKPYSELGHNQRVISKNY